VADSRQFGSPKVPHFGDQLGARTPGSQAGDDAHCVQCEAMLADALDGALSASSQAIFDIHMAHCGPCAQMLADARRGAAWLEMLRDPRPEPPAELLDKILAQTSGALIFGNPALASQSFASQAGIGTAPRPALVPAPIYGAPAPYMPSVPQFGATASGRILPFRTRMVSAVRASAFGQIVLQPRLAMTAAMAFFSIALTLDLTGVRLQDLHASDLRPSSLKRDFYSANARVVQYYEGLRVVYELESRVHDLQSASGNDSPAGAEAAPQDLSPASPSDSSPGASQNGGSPDSGSRTGDQRRQSPTAPAGHTPAAQPKRKPGTSATRPAATRPAPSPGTSRREDLNQSSRLVAVNRGDRSFSVTFNVPAERAQA